MSYPVLEACGFSNDLSDRQVLTTLQGDTVTVDLYKLSINDSVSTSAGLVVKGFDIPVKNGIIHTIDEVLLPDASLQVL